MISAVLLVSALILAAIVFYYISFELRSGQTSANTPVIAPASTNIQASTTTTASTTTVPTSIPLRDLPINDSQQKVLETVGVEIDTFVITPAMQVCAAEKLGAERIAKIVSGDAPTALETARLVPCLGAE